MLLLLVISLLIGKACFLIAEFEYYPFFEIQISIILALLGTQSKQAKAAVRPEY